MHFPEKVSKSDYALISKGALRLFLSVDVVGSTALKQEFREQGRSWIAMAHRFFTSFPNQFSANLAQLARSGTLESIPEFELWKENFLNRERSGWMMVKTTISALSVTLSTSYPNQTTLS